MTAVSRTRRAQRGYALIVIVATVGITATMFLVTTLNPGAVQNEQVRRTNAALALAREALIGRAAVDPNRPGSLPCPDMDTNIEGVNVPNDGIADLLSGNACPSYVGRLPWKTLGLPDLRDADGERLWYALSASFRDAPDNVLNSNSAGQISVSGAVTAVNVAAIVFAPGRVVRNPLGNIQERISPAEQGTVANYLESMVDASNYNVIASDSNNDRFLLITPADIFMVVQKRVAKEIHDALNAYFEQVTTIVSGTSTTMVPNKRFPFAALLVNCQNGNSPACVSVDHQLTGLIPARPDAVGDFPTYSGIATLLASNAASWFDNNRWREVVTYRVSAECTVNTPASCISGSLTVTVNGHTATNQRAAIEFPGVPSSVAGDVSKTIHARGVQ